MKRSFVLLVLGLNIIATSLFSCTKTEYIYEPVIKYDTVEVKVPSISGTVKYSGGNSLLAESNLPLYGMSRATVKLLDGQTEVDSTTTNQSGYFLLDSLTPGSYTLKITLKELYDTYVNEFPVIVEENKAMVFTTDEGFDCILFRPKPLKKKKWTFIHFINNSEMAIANGNMKEIKYHEMYGGSGNELNNIAFVAPGEIQGTTLYYLQKPEYDSNTDNFDDLMSGPTMLSPKYVFNRIIGNDYKADGDPGSYEYLVEKVKYISKLYPADSVALFIYSHGSGIDISWKNGEQSEALTRSISPNPTTQTEITVPQLSKAITEMRKEVNVSVFTAGACLMGMYEVIYDLKNSGLKYAVLVSPTSSGLHNLKYKDIKFITDFCAGNGTAFSMCDEIVKTSSESVVSMYNLGKVDDLATLFNDFAAKMDATDVKYTQPFISSSQRGVSGGLINAYTANYYDLADFALNISTAPIPNDNQGLKESAKKLYDYLATPNPDKAIMATKVIAGNNLDRSKGLNFLLCTPSSPYVLLRDVYRETTYYKDGNTHWDSYLSKIDWNEERGVVWDGSVSAPVLTDGKYILTNPSQLAWVAEQVNSGANNFAGVEIHQVVPFDMNNIPWTPIGTEDKPFKGIFNAKATTTMNETPSNFVCNLKIETKDNRYVGLFGYVMDASLINISIRGTLTVDYSSADNTDKFVGGACGYAQSVLVPVKIANVESLLVMEVIAGDGIVTMGGVCGAVKGASSIVACSSGTKKVLTAPNTPITAGGICGSVEGGSMGGAVVDFCSAAHISASSATQSAVVGGIVGEVTAQAYPIVISNSVSYGTIEAKAKNYAYSGGIVGQSEGKVVIQRSAFVGTKVAAVVENTTGFYESYAGGVVAIASGGVFACLNTGEVDAGSAEKCYSGAIAASSDYPISSCYSTNTGSYGVLGKVSNNAVISNCYYVTNKGAAPDGVKINASGKFSSTLWPTEQINGWGLTAPQGWSSSDSWENPWKSLGSWGEQGDIQYPILNGVSSPN